MLRAVPPPSAMRSWAQSDRQLTRLLPKSRRHAATTSRYSRTCRPTAATTALVNQQRQRSSKALALMYTPRTTAACSSSSSSYLGADESSSAFYTARITATAAAAAVASASAILFTAAAGYPNVNSTLLESSADTHDDDDIDDNVDEDEDETTTILNWSGTHQVDLPSSSYHEPEEMGELETLVRKCHDSGTALRPIGSALSPNGIGFRSTGMVNLVNLDRIIKIDETNMTVTVQAGARVGQVVEALREHGLTLPNLASIAEQQMGGFIQVGAHGTGAKITPVDDFVTSLKLVTPAHGTVTLTPEDGERFHLAKVGLGCLGIVSEVTMSCIPAHNLVEHTFVLTRSQARDQLDTLLKQHKHVRYMWIPYEDAVVVVTNDPEDVAQKSDIDKDESPSMVSEEERFKPLRDLLLELAGDSNETYTAETVKGMGFGELRDALLAFAPLDKSHVRRVNKVEAEFWRRSEGYQIKSSDQLLQFDCGGQQWVWEVCFPSGTYEKNNGNDMLLLEKLLTAIEDEHIAAPAPIEQRWSASSSSLMSPAHGERGGLHSWVGIIMYLPSDDVKQRNGITNEFKTRYCELLRSIGDGVGAASHWAKLEIPANTEQSKMLKEFMGARYPVDKFNALRKEYDPKNILGGNIIDFVLGTPGSVRTSS
mmetsp:Transcript_3853/g.8408  ORF Transcript_3853/g.8408 Transcript_3853/m.8408 type:complete len:653 (+) Transcript_3853:104-2062(+)